MFPLTLHVVSSVKPNGNNPRPIPSASPKQFDHSIYHLNQLLQGPPENLAYHLPRYTTELFKTVLSRKRDKEGVSVYVVFWDQDGRGPQIYERVVHWGWHYCLLDDVDLLQEKGLDADDLGNLSRYAHQDWFAADPFEKLPIYHGAFLFFARSAHPVALGLGFLVHLAGNVYTRRASRGGYDDIDPPAPYIGLAPIPAPPQAREGFRVVGVPDARYYWIIRYRLVSLNPDFRHPNSSTYLSATAAAPQHDRAVQPEAAAMEEEFEYDDSIISDDGSSDSDSTSDEEQDEAEEVDRLIDEELERERERALYEVV